MMYKLKDVTFYIDSDYKIELQIHYYNSVYLILTTSHVLNV